MSPSEPSLRLLIVGGYGVFGGRLVELLADEERLTILVAGRSLEKAQLFCASRIGKASLVAAAFDRDGSLAPQLEVLEPDIVVDASGPFQAYGSAPYRLVEAAITHGADYLDFSDGAAFVRGISRYDAAAKERGVTALSGVSSFPVLTAAVVQHLTRDGVRLTAIRAGIAPSPHAVVGENVIRAISSYAGQAVRVRRNGQAALAHPLTETMRYTIAPPGRLPLPNTLFSLMEVPDLQLLADARPETATVWVGAGPRPEILHRALIGLSLLVRAKLLPSLLPLAPLLYHANRILRWGAHRGGMFVEIEGHGQGGARVRRSWHLNAEGDDGPYIPSMAIEALIRKRLAGERSKPGARPATGALSLADYYQVFSGRTFVHGTRDETALAGRPLYQRVLGEAYDALPPSLRAMHALGDGVLRVRGRACVERGKGCWRVLSPGSLASRPKPTTFPSPSPSRRKARASSGSAISAAGASQACRCRARAARQGWSRSASVRSASGSPSWSRTKNCIWWCATGTSSACPCLASWRPAATASRARKTAASTSKSRSSTRCWG
ncbi:hypothetical protein GCM10007874_20750 [Labrys miyagiensis]|uniref:Saccharopine dehydrogenase NADP binding domain-containing protein n=1 Tax=Labrys miyagiensis TaxID=346912 RepID=A0ABQ6CH78_9HYPH|nr:hypothetical protein GCM10007874_20750 [Labrys miyagiensis]